MLPCSTVSVELWYKENTEDEYREMAEHHKRQKYQSEDSKGLFSQTLSFNCSLYFSAFMVHNDCFHIVIFSSQSLSVPQF